MLGYIGQGGTVGNRVSTIFVCGPDEQTLRYHRAARPPLCRKSRIRVAVAVELCRNGGDA